MPTYAHHVLEAIQHTREPISLESIISFVKSDRKKHNLTKTSERHVQNALTKLLKAKLIKTTDRNLYCMIDTSPTTNKKDENNNPTPKIPEKKSKRTHKKQISAYNLFTKHFLKENKDKLFPKRNLLMREMSKKWKQIKSDVEQHQYWKQQAKDYCCSDEEEEEEEEEVMNFELDVADLSAEFKDTNELPQINAGCPTKIDILTRKNSSSNIQLPLHSKMSTNGSDVNSCKDHKTKNTKQSPILKALVNADEGEQVKSNAKEPVMVEEKETEGEPKVQVQEPEVQVQEPEVQVQEPEVKAGEPEVNAEQSEVGIEVLGDNETLPKNVFGDIIDPKNRLDDALLDSPNWLDMMQETYSLSS